MELGTEEAGVVPSLGIYLALVHSLSMDSYNMALFYFSSGLVLLVKAWLLSNSSHLLLGYTEPYRQEGSYLSVVPEEMGECWFL